MKSHGRLLFLLGWVFLLSFFFANVEVAIEGPAGWAQNLPTWRIEHHWLLDLFFGGRAMTGYHAWVFPFVALFFHLPIFFVEKWSWRSEFRVLACIALFWISEDFLWFVVNPAFGVSKFAPEFIPWHKHWLFCAPVDYWIGLFSIIVLLYFAHFRKEKA